MYHPRARFLSVLSVVGFGCMAVISLWYSWNVFSWVSHGPLLLFYAVLLCNTYFSVRYFGTLSPSDKPIHIFFDAVLVCLYTILAASLAHTQIFVFLSTIMFGVAALKYVVLQLHQKKALRELTVKTWIDTLGTVACTLAFGGVVFGYAHITIYVWSGAFLIANIYLLSFSRIYKLD